MEVQFWDLYCIKNQIGETLDKVWDGQEVKLTFIILIMRCLRGGMS